MDQARSIQFAIWRSWTPARRLAVATSQTTTALRLRDQRLRERHPDADPETFRRLRIAATLRSSPTWSLP